MMPDKKMAGVAFLQPATDSGAVESRFKLANQLAASGHKQDEEQARTLYLQLINEIPDYAGAWINLGILLFDTGYISAAHTAFFAASTYHPQNAVAHLYLANVLLYQHDLAAASSHYQVALALNPELTEAHRGLAGIFERLGKEAAASFHRHEGYYNTPSSSLSYRGSGCAIPLLILASCHAGNIPWQRLIDRNIFDTTLIAVEYFTAPLPPHQLLFNAIGDADLCREALTSAMRLIRLTVAPVINHPAEVLHTGRLMNGQRLGALPGVRAAQMTLIAKADFFANPDLPAKLTQTLPLLLRSPGFHGGNYFVQVNSPRELAAAFCELPGDTLLAIEFLESVSGDTLFRKYRVMCINGVLYPLHMAISSHWNVHYFSSDMAENVLYREEEQAFLHDFYACLQPQTIAALKLISQTMALDYFGIDFGIARNGDVLLYEANPTMAIVPPGHEAQWDYRREPIQNALDATKKLFIERLACAKVHPQQEI